MTTSARETFLRLKWGNMVDAWLDFLRSDEPYKVYDSLMPKYGITEEWFKANIKSFEDDYLQ